MAKPYMPYEGPVVTREQAKAAGLSRFFTGKPCKRGHLSQRTTANGGCFACNSADALALYHAEAPEKRALRWERAKVWKDAHREQVRAEGRAYSKANRDKSQAWKVANRAQIAEAERLFRIEQPERYKARVNRYRATDKGAASVRTSLHNRRARLKCVEGEFTAPDIQRIGDRQKWKCHWCGVPTKHDYHVDHLISLAKGGTNWPSNLVIACPPCNQSKGASDPLDYARRKGRLL